MTPHNSSSPPDGSDAAGTEPSPAPSDFADTLPDAVEGFTETQSPSSDHPRSTPSASYPKRPAVDAAKEVYDRSAIIGHDGRVAAGWALRFIVTVVALYIFFKLLSYVWVGLLPVLLAILVSTVLWPMTRFLRRHKFPAALAAITTLLTFLVVIGGVFAAMAPVIRTQGQDIIDQAIAGANQINSWLHNNPFGINTADLNLDELLQDGLAFLQGQSQNIASGVFSGLSAASSVVVTLVVMMLITFFILKDGDEFLPMVRRYTGTTAGWHLSEVLTRTWNTLSGFIKTQALVSFIDAFFIGVGLWILGVPLAFVLAVITFFGGFIPIVGAFSAGALAVVIGLVTQGPTTAVIVLALIIAVQQLEGNILQPILQSKAMNLHAAVVLLSVTVGSTLFGIIGAFLAVPVAATLAVWMRYHSQMVALRAGEITVDDIEIATSAGQSLSSREAFHAVRDHLLAIGTRKPKGEGSTAASKAKDSEVAGEAVDNDPIFDDKESADNSQRLGDSPGDSAGPGPGRRN